jgi:4-amino-4-deoxychorismate lyase
MCRLFETIKISDGVAENLSFHNTRLNASRKELFGCADTIDLREIITVPDRHGAGRHKCRVVYSTGIHEVIFEPYPGRSITSLKIVYCDDIEYPYKNCDREKLNALFRLRNGCDEILIVKNHLVTDTSISNIAFFDGSCWVTPRSVLLRGTKREQLITRGIIAESEITVTDIAGFKKACLINAMLDLGETIVEIENIVN